MNKYIIDYSVSPEIYNFDGTPSLIIQQNFLSEKEFNNLIDNLKDINLKHDSRSLNRKSLCLKYEKHKNIYDCIYKNNNLKKLIDILTNKNYKEKPQYPIEYRLYPLGSQGMNWHQDTSMFTPNALECVLTVTNTSDSNFLWKINNHTFSTTPEVNTLMIVRPEAIVHSVSPINQGERKILKFIIEFNNSIPKDEFNREINSCPH